MEIFGQRLYVGVGIAVGAFLQIMSPLASHWHPLALASVNLLLGLCYGPMVAAIYSLLAAWGPSYELMSMNSMVQGGKNLVHDCELENFACRFHNLKKKSVSFILFNTTKCRRYSNAIHFSCGCKILRLRLSTLAHCFLSYKLEIKIFLYENFMVIHE